MKQNLGPSDRILRMSLAGVLITAWFTHFLRGLAGTALALAALLLVLTSIGGYCPIYNIVGRNTSN